MRQISSTVRQTNGYGKYAVSVPKKRTRRTLSSAKNRTLADTLGIVREGQARILPDARNLAVGEAR